MAAVSARGLDEHVRERLRVRAARHGRSTEAEIRAILADAASEPTPSNGRYGIERLPAGSRRDLQSATAAEVFSAFADHVLPFEAEAAAEYAGIVSRREHAGTRIDGFDAQISSLCRTRRDFGDAQTSGTSRTPAST